MSSVSSESGRREALGALGDLRAEIDREAGRVAARSASRLRCGRGCADCCQDDLRVAPVEAARIRAAHAELLAKGAPGPIGGCAFLDAERACRIYADRPAVCRSQGLPLRFFVEDEHDEVIERRDICPLNLEGGPPLHALSEDDCWLIGPFELRLEAVDRDYREATDDPSGRDDGRVALRSLFARAREEAPA